MPPAPVRSGRPTGAAGIKGLQATAGNQATLAMLSRVQRALQVGAADDPFEREADAVARRVADALASGAPSTDPASEPAGGSAPAVRRKVRPGESPGGPVGAEGGPVAAESESMLHGARSSGGAPLPGPQRQRLEQAFGGADFSQVRLHTGSVSADLNDRFGAKAFTVGSDIFFRESAPSIDTRAGTELLAHELTHTIQQGGH
ncbi:MAG TPA: DUF4157 domain-containing protein [Acidimicrobiales bacterium]|nr:DUF4157 domain-containing protein [Acidimicrobiales bacterium]